MQDIPAIAAVAHDKGAVVLMDNTWATPLYYPAFERGVDLSIQAGTKYIGGHSDIMFGTVSANAATWPKLKETVNTYGLCAGPDDIYLALRGLRTHGGAARAASEIRARESRDGSSSGRKCCACCIRPFPPIPVTRSGNATSPAHPGLFSIVLKPAVGKGGACLLRRAHPVRDGIFLGRL